MSRLCPDVAAHPAAASMIQSQSSRCSLRAAHKAEFHSLFHATIDRSSSRLPPHARSLLSTTFLNLRAPLTLSYPHLSTASSSSFTASVILVPAVLHSSPDTGTLIAVDCSKFYRSPSRSCSPQRPAPLPALSATNHTTQHNTTRHSAPLCTSASLPTHPPEHTRPVHCPAQSRMLRRQHPMLLTTAPVCICCYAVPSLCQPFGAEEQEKHAEERRRLLGPAAHPLAQTKPHPLDRPAPHCCTCTIAPQDWQMSER